MIMFDKLSDRKRERGRGRVILFMVLTPSRLRHQAPARCVKLAILLRG